MSNPVTFDLETSSSVSRPTMPRAGTTSTFYSRIAAFLLVLVVAGFGPTFFFRPFTGLEPLPAPALMHGIVLTGWFVLFYIQASLIARRCTRLHRALGIAGAGVAALATLGFVWMAVDLYLSRPPNVAEELIERARIVRIMRELTVFAAFPVFVGLGVAFRRRTAVHKRMMLLATIALTPPALSRLVFWPAQVWPEIAMPSRIVGALGGAALLVLFIVLREAVTNGRVHPAMAWGAPAWFTWLIGSGLMLPILMM